MIILIFINILLSTTVLWLWIAIKLLHRNHALQIRLDFKTVSETSKIPQCWLDEKSHRKKISQHCKVHSCEAMVLVVTKFSVNDFDIKMMVLLGATKTFVSNINRPVIMHNSTWISLTS